MENADHLLKQPIILVVDDDENIRKLALHFLEQSGFAVQEAADGLEALNLVRERNPDLVLLDVILPGMDGFGVCSEMRKLPGGDLIPILMITGMGDIDLIRKAYEVGATDFILKPINWLILEQRIRYMLKASDTFNDLLRSESKNRALLNAMPDAIFHINRDGVFLDFKWTRDFVMLVKPEEVAGKTVSQVFPDVLSQKIISSMEKALETEETQVFEYVLSREKTVHYFEARIAICSELEVLAIMRDITERKRFEEALRFSEMKYRIVAENTYDWEFWLGPEGQFIYTSPSCKTITGYTAAEFEVDSNLFLKIVHPDDLVKCATHCNVKAGTLKAGELEYRIRNRDGSVRWIGHVCQPVYDSDGTYLGIRGSNRDITEQKRAAEMVRREEERRIRHEEKKKQMHEKDKLLKDLHDGIGGIITNVSLLSEMAQNSSSADYVTRTLSTISDLSREALSELRNFMNILDDRRLDWHSFVADMRNLGSTMIEGNGLAFNVSTSVQPGFEHPGSFLCLTIFRLYKEALTNIIKHSKASAVEVAISVKPKKFVLSVHDDGVGIVEKPGEGRGMLNMSSRAEEIGGTLTVSYQKGTRIHLELPLPIKYP